MSMDLTSLLVGVGAGALVACLLTYFLFQRKLHDLTVQTRVLGAENSSKAEQLLQMGTQARQREEGYLQAQQELSALRAKQELYQQEISRLREHWTDREQFWSKIQEKVQHEFQGIARDALDLNARRLTDSQKQNLSHLLDPLKQQLGTFEKQVSETYDRESRERLLLQKELQQLMQLNTQMSEEARKLTQALKGDQKMQGNWGELILARVLESAGLREGEEFFEQSRSLALRSEEGKRYQPDIIIKLPENKHLIIDAKVSLTAYERWVSLDVKDASEREKAFGKHVQSLKNHIQQLSKKHYQRLEGVETPDFVLLFLAVEPAFTLAVQQRPELFAYAWDRKIVLTSPNTLLATLKTVASIWMLNRQNQNAQEIARQGGFLYDKFVGFVEEMEKVGKAINGAQNNYEDAMRKLRDGKGNLLRRAEKLRELGAQTQKRLEL